MVVNSAEKFFDLSHSLTIVIAQNELNLLYDTYSFKHYTKAATKTYTMVLTRHAEVGTPFVSLSVLFSLSFKRKNINTRTITATDDNSEYECIRDNINLGGKRWYSAVL